mmetsp:Transcript_17854/g.19885  ORF Transcript_17854/g.19885 Transcript_17854/m.19885 type:complete len:253 (+) Transcript_17854:1-759(+)
MDYDAQMALALQMSLNDTGGQTWEPPQNLDKERAQRDMARYRANYPGEDYNDKSLASNLMFYKGLIKSHPDGETVDVMHTKWFGNYELLEKHHSYIQWLFPLREKGGNKHVNILQLHEIEAIKADPEAKNRLLKSYQMMLDFFGMRFKAGTTVGEIERNPSNWSSRYRELNIKWNHNFLRITRMLKSLGEFGFESPYKINFLRFIFNEIFSNGQLINTKDAATTYWLYTLRNDAELKEMEDLLLVLNKHNSA